MINEDFLRREIHHWHVVAGTSAHRAEYCNAADDSQADFGLSDSDLNGGYKVCYLLYYLRF